MKRKRFQLVPLYFSCIFLVICTLVAGKAQAAPKWEVSPGSLGPTCFVGFDAASMSFELKNVGDDDTINATVTNSSSGIWAMVVNGTVPILLTDDTYTINVSFDTDALRVGAYQAELIVTGAAQNSPLKIPVTLLVKDVPSSAACGEIPLYAQDLVNPAIMVQLDTSGSMSTSMTIAKSDDQVTPDIKTIVQAIVNRTGWGENNDMAFIISGSGKRRAWSFDGDADDAPKLTIKYNDSDTEVTVERKIGSSSDDVQVISGIIDDTETYLELGLRNSPVGLRFVDISIPKGAEIIEAVLSFSVYQGDSDITSLVIQAIDSDDVSDIDDASDFTGLTKESVSWSPGDWSESMSRIDIAEDVLKEVFLDRSISWGFATWAGGKGPGDFTDYSPDYLTHYHVGVHEHDDAHQAILQDKVYDGSPSGWTPLVPTMRGGLEYFKGNRKDGHYSEFFNELSCQPRILVIVTDGLGDTGTDNDGIDTVVKKLAFKKISVVTVGFGLTDASQLDRIAQAMKIAGEANDDDYLYSLHYVKECSFFNDSNCGEVKEECDDDHTGECVAVPFMAQNRQEFIDAMNNTVSSVKAQVFHGSSPALTTSINNGEILLNASFDASDWSGNITATKFDAYTGQLELTDPDNWDTRVANNWNNWNSSTDAASVNGFIFDSTATKSNFVSPYMDSSIAGDNFLCKPMGDVINSTPAIVGSPPFYYRFDSYFDFKFKDFDSNVVGVNPREEVAYVGANDGALHAFRLSNGVEKWRFYPNSVRAKMALALNPDGTSTHQDDMCSPAYCHKFLLDGSPEPADIFVNAATFPATVGWRTILTTGLGEGGSAYFALDVTYGEDFDAPNVATVPVASTFLWEFTETDDGELGLATSWPSIARVRDAATSGAAGWATYFGSGRAVNEVQQQSKEAYLFAVNSWDKSRVWTDGATTPVPVYKVKLVSGTLLNDEPAPPLVIDTQNDDYQADRIYLGNLYGNMYRVKDIGFAEHPVSELLFDSANTDHSTPVTAKAGYANAGNGDIWLYFGTGKYRDQIDKFTVDQQYFYGLFDAGAAEATPYIQSGLVEITTEIIEAYALDEDGARVDFDDDGTDDLRSYRTLSCPSPDSNGNCNPNNLSWALKLVIPATSASERTISQPLIVGGIVFFTTFVPDGDVCEGNGDTWLFAVDWQSGEFVSTEVFDINESGGFDLGDRTVQDTGGNEQGVAGIYIGTGRPSGELAIHNDILFVGTTGQPPKPIKVNLPEQRVRLRSWQQVFH